MEKSNHEQHQFLKKRENNETINKIVNNTSSTFFIAITSFYPLFIGAGGYMGISYKKALFFWIAVGIAIIMLLFMKICKKEKFGMDSYYAENDSRRKITLAEWSLFVFIVWTFISAVTSAVQNPEWSNRGFGGASVWFGANDRYEGFITFLCYAITFFIIARFYKVKHLHLQLIAVSAILISIIGVLQFLGLDILGGLSLEFNSLHGSLSARYRTTLGYVNLVSAYCSFAVLLFATLFTVSRSKWQYLYLGAGACAFALSLTTGFSGDSHKVAILTSMILLIPYWISDRERLGRIFIVLSSWCIVFTGHGAYMSAMKRQYEAGVVFLRFDQQLLNSYTHKNIAMFLTISAALLVVGLALILLLKTWNEKVMKIVGVFLLPVMLISGLIGLEIIGSRLSNQPYNVIWQAREMIHGRLSDDFGSGRGWIWRNTIEVIPDNPIFGTGPDTLYHALGTERQSEAAKLYSVNFDKAHNIFLQIAVCMGIPALIAYLIFLGSIFIPAIKRAFERPILLAFGAAALGYVIQSFFSIEGPIIAPLFWISLGVMTNEVWMTKIGYKSIEL